MTGTGQTGVELDRVVAVTATWADGRAEVGSGYLVTGRLVLTAGHCIRDKESGKHAAEIKVVRASDGATVPCGNVIVCPELDVAVIALEDDAPWGAELRGVVFARVDRTRAGMLEDCQAIGFPLFQRDSQGPATSEVHGTLYQTDGAESGQLLIRDPRISPGPLSTQKIPYPGGSHPSAWGGFSGATLFHHGLAIGVIIEHHPAQGGSALRATAFDTLIQTAADDPEACKVADALGLPRRNNLPWAAAEPVEPLAGLVERLASGDLPLVQDLNPYLAGATESRYGTRESAGTDDPYVARTYHDVDARVRQLLVPGRMVLLVGPSKAGKTRTAFEAVRTTWPRARLLIPATTSLAALAKHPLIRSSTDAIVLWLNDLQRYLTGIREPLTPALLTALLARPGNTVVVATLRTEEWSRLLDRDDELTREARRVLEEATEVELGPTSDNPAEQAAAQDAYPGQDLSTYGLAEQLAGAPYLLKQYRGARRADPLLHAVIQTAIDWTRVGMPDPMPETDLAELALNAVFAHRPDLDPTRKEIRKSIMAARTPPEDAGRVAALATVGLPDRTRGYLAFSYLVASDDGQTDEVRPIPDNFWPAALDRADPAAAYAISEAAYMRGNRPTALQALEQAAKGGVADAMNNIGVLLAEQEDPDLSAALTWYEKASKSGSTTALYNLGNLLLDQLNPPNVELARKSWELASLSGNTSAQYNLGNLLVTRLNPPDVEGARRWWEMAASAGHTRAAYNLGNLHTTRLNPPDLEGARRWYEQAAQAGNTDSMINLGSLVLQRLDPPDFEGAYSWLKQAAKAGRTEAMINLGILLLRNLNSPAMDEARNWFEQAAQAGNSDAMVQLGVLLEERVEPPDIESARRWYEKAAQAGSPAGAFNLGLLIATQDSPPDLEKVHQWWEQAARAGHARAAFNLGHLLAEQKDPPDVHMALKWYERAAKAGVTEAMYNLGLLLEDGLEKPDVEGARYWYEKAAKAGNSEAMMNLGILLANRVNPPDVGTARLWLEKSSMAGNKKAMDNLTILLQRWPDSSLNLLAEQKDPPDVHMALKWYERAAKAGVTEAMYNLGLLLEDGLEKPDVEGARYWYEKAAKAGNSGAMHNLGNLLAYRVDPPQPEEARRWYEQAAAAGDTDAMVNLGNLLADQPDPPDLGQARRWYEQAATAGHPGAMNNLGNLLAYGVDPPQPEEARRWYEQAATAGHTGAMLNLGILLADQADLGQARRWYEQAAAAGHTGAMLNLGILLANQMDPPDLGQARRWYEQAAAAGDTDAMVNLGNLLADQLDPPDLGQARRWYEQAATAGHPGAMNNLGNLLAYGVDPAELEEARRWYEQAATAGNTGAMHNLGILLADRLDPPDLGQARRWYEQAATAGNTDAMNSLGELLAARVDPPELEGARSAWQAVINAGAGNGNSEAVGWAALALALLDALVGDAPHATELLELAEHHGVPSAYLYKGTLSPDPSVRAAALQNLENSPNDSDGLNFLGIASYRAGEPATAKHYWLRSLKLDDVYAPLLLHITRNPSLPGSP